MDRPPKMQVRIQPDIELQVRRASEKSGRSLQAEVNYSLRQFYTGAAFFR